MSDRGWHLTSHCCRQCLGRVLKRDDEYMCADCEAVARSKPDAICGCGMRIEAMRSRTGTTDVFRCGPNPQRSHANPACISILFGHVVAVPLGDI